MTTDSVIVRPVQSGDEAAWRGMWEMYCTFNDQSIPETVTANLWERMLDGASPVNTVLAMDGNGIALGFANYVLHPHTWSDRTICYLEDLFVRPEERGRGVGHALIVHLVETGKSRDWGRVYWHTETGNAAARRLYDRFKPADDLVRYTIDLTAQ